MLAILTANLGSFDTIKEPVPQNCEYNYHCFDDSNYPPITGLTPRFQYRIPKIFGWQLFPDYDCYLWLDGAWSFTRPDCAEWFLEQLGDGDMAFFKHPTRKTVREEVAHIEEYLNKGDKYLTPRYKNGLHKEQLENMPHYFDDRLYASTAFIYKNTREVREAMTQWWLNQSRYFTCDQVSLPYAVRDLDVRILDAHIYKTPYLTEVSKHK